jgi:hypothetical protein
VFRNVVKGIPAKARCRKITDGIANGDTTSVLCCKLNGTIAASDQDHPASALRHAVVRCVKDLSRDRISYFLERRDETL